MCPHLHNHTTEESRKANNICFKCNKRGHRAADCTETSPDQRPNFTKFTNRQTNNQSDSNTGKTQKNNSNDTSDNSQRNNNPTLKRNFARTPINIFKNITIRKVQFKALFDTGSELTLLAKSVFDKLQNVILCSETIEIFGIGQGKLTTLGYIITKAKIDDIEFVGHFHIVNDSDIVIECFLGSNILKTLNVYLSGNTARFELKEKHNSIEDILFEEMLGPPDETYNNFTLGHEFEALCRNISVDTDVELETNTHHIIKKRKLTLRTSLEIINQFRQIVLL